MEPKYLRLEIESDDGTVQPVRIEVSTWGASNYKENAVIGSDISAFEKLRVKNILKEEYGFTEVEIE